ncbi:iron uptake transporter deferrochelatase/peroxidase subunit [Paenibacillus sp. GCM10023248]|uniref:iron uptake transporter deferrochelatase/peroxidase subunit n=1 Tax=Bacillales TaxID=1385 RepID=UPI00237858FF|nr:MULTISPECIES: iron uptake transporter deferrochelatase/peroxidase subunit [Bacillales]MDD9267798.1 iron uptake transporter deferrochelatase/peroxidase subunit [Paenibacillus sp. MAHUQ-63]MDR6882259.1 deferrochelatase/peroxidase EfeB [Bacillus sp. 3255]
MPDKMNRRAFLGMTAAGAAGLVLGQLLDKAQEGVTGSTKKSMASADAPNETISFYGPHQTGVLTPAQNFANMAAFDVTTSDVQELKELLKTWTEMAATLMAGKPLAAEPQEAGFPPTDTGEQIGLDTGKLTLTFAIGATLFEKDGVDRFGIRARKPAGLTEMPIFHKDSLQDQLTHGDLLIQACSDDPMICFHAIRNLAKAARGVAHLRWQQTGQLGVKSQGTKRNLFGFKDGTNNPALNDDTFMKNNVWIDGSDGAPWLAGGTFMVVRRIQMRIETWDQQTYADQEEIIGRQKVSGAPLDGQNELDQPDFAGDPAGKVTALDSHIRLSNPRNGEQSERERILRRGYNFMENLDSVGRLSAGLLFVCFNRNIQTQFESIQKRLTNPKLPDQMLAYTETTGGGYFAVLPGVAAKESYLGQSLFV